MDKKITEEINLKCSIKIKKEIKRDLVSLLKLHNKNSLKEIYFSIKKEETDSNSKDLVSKIFNELTKKEVLCIFLKNMLENEYDVLIELLNNNGLSQDNYVKFSKYDYLFNYGIAYPLNYENKVYIVISNEVLDILNDIDIYSYKSKILENNRLYDLANSMINLYGVVPFDLFLDYLKKYYGYKDLNKIDLDCLYLTYRKNCIVNFSTQKNIYFTNPIYLDEESDKTIIYRVISLIEDDLFKFDFKNINLDDLLKYKDMYYYEKTDSVEKFIKYLESKNMSYEDIDLLVSCIVETFRKNYQESIMFLNEIFEDTKYIINENNIDEVLLYINGIVNDISIWGNKGWTNKDIILNKHLDT